MALGTHPVFLASATKPISPEPRAKGKPETSQLPIMAGFTFAMQSQQQSNWCWAAVTTSVNLYYHPNNTNWPQCAVVNAVLSRSNCCTSPLPDGCNAGVESLDAPLTATGNFASQTGPISNNAVYDELLAGRPLAAAVSWEGGGGHAVVIHGYSFFMQAHRFDISDPFYGYSFIFTNTFRYAYQGSGTWFETDYTQATP
jgi:hypothetical protein